MALPTAFIKAKNAISKGVQSARTARAVNAATSNSSEQGVNSFFSIFKLPLMIVIPIAGTIAAFIFVVFLAIVAIPQILVGTIFGGGSLSSNINGGVSGGPVGPGLASSVVECARQQIGKPYVWGAEGPNAFDCSGLVTYCYRQALGVEVPHQTKKLAKSSAFRTVSSVDQLSPGDIILDGGNNISHVGIYSGNGTVIHAPEPGSNVTEISLERFQNAVAGFETYRTYIGQ